MGRPKGSSRSLRPTLTTEAQESRMISLAIDLAEKKLRDGTASSQLITHYLKMASPKERTEREILEAQKKLIIAKTESLESQKRNDELYDKAIAAMRKYRGAEEPEDDEDY